MHPFLKAGLIHGQFLRAQEKTPMGKVSRALKTIDGLLSEMQIRGVASLDPERSMDWSVFGPQIKDSGRCEGGVRFTPRIPRENDEPYQLQLALFEKGGEVVIQQQYRTPSKVTEVGSSIPVEQIEDCYFSLGQSLMQMLSEQALASFNPVQKWEAEYPLYGFQFSRGGTVLRVFDLDGQTVVDWQQPEDFPKWLKGLNFNSPTIDRIINAGLVRDGTLEENAVVLNKADFAYAKNLMSA